MKRLITVLLPLIFFSLVIFPILAQDEATTPASPSLGKPTLMGTKPGEVRLEKLEQFRDQLRLRREAIREQIQERRVTIRARISEVRKERIRHIFNRLIKRFEAAITRLEKLISRIESRLDKIEAANEDIDTSSIRDELDKAKDSLASAKTAIAEAKASLEDILSSEDPREAFGVVRDLIKEIKTELVEVHRILVHVIGNIRGLRVGVTRGELPTPATPAAEGE